MVSATPIARFLLRYLGGAAALVAIPGVWLYTEEVLSRFVISPAYLNGLWAEAALAAAASIVCAMIGLRPLFWVVAPVLALHYGLWWHTFGALQPTTPSTSLLFPVMGLCSSAVWALYLREELAIQPTRQTSASA
jgi:hypothetical protein